MILFSITLALSTFSKPLQTYHKHQTKYVPLKEFTKPKPLRLIPGDLNNIKRISLQPTLPFKYKETDDNLIGEQPWHLRGRKTIVLDLDETLFNVDNVKSWYGDAQASVFDGLFGSPLRPFHKPFIQACKKHFEVVVWTRSDYDYAIKKCEWLGLLGVPLITGWQDCDELGAKPLYKLNRKDSHILLIDDDTVHLSANPRSQLLIPPWDGNVNDCELQGAIDIITKIAKEPTVQDSLDICLAQSYIYEKRRTATLC